MLAFVALLTALASATPAKDSDDAFRARFLALRAKAEVSFFAVRMAPSDDPAALPDKPATAGVTPVAAGRMGIYVPPILSPEDLSAVIGEHMVEIRKCFQKQLAANADWSEELILDLAVKKTGRVTEVAVSPGRAKRDVVGQCLMSEVPKWKFPEFTGELDDGTVQEVVTASFPFSFNVR